MHTILERMKDEIDYIEGKDIDTNTLQNILMASDLTKNYSICGSIYCKGANVRIQDVSNFEIKNLGDSLYGFFDTESKYSQSFFTIHIDGLKECLSNGKFKMRVCYSECQWIDIQYGINNGTKDRQDWYYLVTLTFRPKY